MSVGVLKQTNIDVTLREPRSLVLPKGPKGLITELRVYADDPKALIRRAHELHVS